MPFDRILLQRIKNNDPTLTSIKIKTGSFNDEDIIGLAELLKNNPHVIKVVLQGDYLMRSRHNRLMGARGALALAECQYIQELDISNNDIGNEGFFAISAHKGLKILRANVCNVGVDGVISLLNSESLHEVYMVGGNLPFHSAEHNKEGLEKLGISEGLEERSFRTEWNRRLNEVLRRNQERDIPALISTHRADDLEKELKKAIDEEQADRILELLREMPEGANTGLYFGYSHSEPSLMYAINEGKVISAQTLLRAGAFLEDHEREYTALFDAAEWGQLEACELLLSHGSSLKGEFYFNKETPLSISTFKFLEQISGAILPIFFEKIKIPSQKKILEEALKAIQRFLRNERLDWRDLGRNEALCESLFLNACLLYNTLRKQQEISSDSPLYRYAKIAELLFNKTKVNQALSSWDSGVAASSLPSPRVINESDYEQRFPIKKTHGISKPTMGPETTGYLDEGIIIMLNKQLESKDLREISWEQLPKLFIAQYRGIHYYTHVFPPIIREDHLRTFHLNRLAAAPAAYRMLGLKPAQHQLARESELLQGVETIFEVFEELYNTEDIQVYGRRFRNASDAMQERMSSRYEDFQRDVREGNNVPAKRLKDAGIEGYPHYATSDLPRHPLRYGYGRKMVSSLSQGILVPSYDINGKPRYPYLGKFFISLFTPLALTYHKARHVFKMDKDGLIRVRNKSDQDTIVPERETSIPGGVNAEYVFYETVLEVPDFSEPYSAALHLNDFGINEDDYKKFRRSIIASAHRGIQPDLSELLDKVCNHKEKEMLRIATEEARAQGGYLIYCHDEKQYGLKPFCPNKTEEALFREISATPSSSNTSLPSCSSLSPYSSSARLFPSVKEPVSQSEGITSLDAPSTKRQCTPASRKDTDNKKDSSSLSPSRLSVGRRHDVHRGFFGDDILAPDTHDIAPAQGPGESLELPEDELSPQASTSF